MSRYAELAKQAKAKRENGQFAEAAALYGQLYNDFSEDCSQWDLWAYASCLIKIKDYHRALEIARRGYQKDSTFKPVRQVYGWAIYHTAIKSPRDDTIFAKAVQAIMQLTDSADRYAPNTLTVLKAGEYWNKKQYWAKTIDLLTAIAPEVLDIKSHSYTGPKGERVELASPLEKYYALLTKALIAEKQWQQCIDVAGQALKSISKFHFANNIWFRWRMSEAYYHLGQYEPALRLLNYIQERKKDWFIISAIGVNKMAQGHLQEAKLFFAKACLANGEMSKKVKTLRHLVEIFRKEQNRSALDKHLRLLKSIYEQERWKWPEELDGLIAEHWHDEAVAFRQIIGQVRRIWEDIVYADLEELTGEISHVFPNGKAGFVKSNRQSYFATIREFKAKPSQFQKGIKVRFYLKDGYDKKKQVATKDAYNIRLIN